MRSLLSSLDRWLAPAPDPARVAWLRGVTYAHRGLHGPGAVENSATAFAAALAAGLGIECDVQLAADGKALVFHDRELGRLTGQGGPVTERSLAQLTRIVLTGSDDRIPSLPDVLRQVGGRAALLIELKTTRESAVSALCRAVCADLRDYDGDCAVMSFDPRVGSWFARHAPGTVRGLVVSEVGSRGARGMIERRLALRRARPDFLAYDVRDLRSRFAAAQRARGFPLLTWTVRTKAQLERALRCADGWIAEGDGLSLDNRTPSPLRRQGPR